MDIYTVIGAAAIFILVGLLIKRDNAITKDSERFFDNLLEDQNKLLKSKVDKILELEDQNKLLKSKVDKISEFEDQNKQLLSSNEIYKEEIHKLKSEVARLKSQQKTIFIDNSDRYTEIIKEKKTKIISLEKRIEVLKNKNFYKVSFEKAEAQNEELHDKIRMLERNLEVKRKEVANLKNRLGK